MNRLIEILLGLEKGFLNRDGDFSLQFNPQWPFPDALGAAPWNVLLAALAIGLVYYVYRRESRSRAVRIALACVRGALLALVIVLLNRPVISLTQTRVEPSVLAIMIDDSLSMRVKDMKFSPQADPQTRAAAIADLLGGEQGKMIRTLSAIHQVRFYSFDSDARALATTAEKPVPEFEPQGQKTQVARSIRTAMQDLQGQRLAGVVVLTDGRDQPQQSIASAVDEVKDFGVPIYPVPVGTDDPMRNIEVQSVSVQDAVFVNDIANIKTTVRAVGGAVNTPITLRLVDKKTGKPMLDAEGHPIEKIVRPTSDQPLEEELQWRPTEIGPADVTVEAVAQSGEVDDQDNARTVQLAVLDAKVKVLYVDGYPRWDYRYLKNEMIRDKSVDISCLLLSADPSFKQEGDSPITRFPETIQELLAYDVVLFGDCDPREFSDAQLQLLNDYVAKRGGGFGMTAGPRFSPAQWKGTPIEAILPVDITGNQSEAWGTDGSLIAEGFRPVLTKDGEDSSIFRFFPDKARNQKYLKEELQTLFWYAHNLTVKPGVGEVYAEHPADNGPDGRRAPILVVGRYGAGRTLFSAIDDSWRWRYYTGESIFNTYWVQQLRYLARGRKLGERQITLASQKPVYELGEQERLILRIIDPQLISQLPEQIRVEVTGEDGGLVAQQSLIRQEGGDTYVASYPADRVGKFTVKLPSVAPGVNEISLPIEVAIPKLELSQPQIDRTALSRLASETSGKVIEFKDARDALSTVIRSAERKVPVISSQPLWDAPIALVAFVLLIAIEWIARKLLGMV